MNSKAPLCIFFNTYYSKYIDQIYHKHPQLAEDTYENQKKIFLDGFFGDCDFYSKGLIKAGWRAEVFIGNVVNLQNAWAREHNFSGEMFDIALEQVKMLKPQVIYLQEMADGSKEILDALRPYTDLIVGQIACPLSESTYLKGFDIIFTSFPHFVKFFKQKNITSYYQPLAFEPRILEKITDFKKKYPVTFIGSITIDHKKGEQIISKIIDQFPIDIWGWIDEYCLSTPLLKYYHGEVWGLEMFKLFSQSLITINRHIDVAENYANNMRLFESTGCGAMLLTDYKDNLNDLFEIGKEVVAYRTPEECVELIKYYLKNPDEAREIAIAGQKRTLRDHTYEKRMKQTAEIFNHHLSKKNVSF